MTLLHCPKVTRGSTYRLKILPAYFPPLKVQQRWGLISNYSPGRKSSKYILFLHIFTTVQCTEGSNMWRIKCTYTTPSGTRWCIWLRHCATSRKIAGWNPDGATGIFHWHNPAEEETSKMLHLEHGFVWCWNLDASGSRSEIPGKLWNVVLEKDGEDQLDRSCEKWRSVTSCQWAEEYPTWNTKTEG